MNNLTPSKIALGVILVAAAGYAYWEDSQQNYQPGFNSQNNSAWVRGQNGPGPNQQGQCPPGTLPTVGPGSQGGCSP